MQDAIDVQNAWVIFQSADRFHLQGIRQKSKDKILIEAEKAFETRPLVRDELLEEVLVSDLMCITNEKLESLLRKWDAPDATNRWALVDRWVSTAKMPNRKCGESTADLLVSEADLISSVKVSHSTRKQEQLFILQTGSLLASPWQTLDGLATFIKSHQASPPLASTLSLSSKQVTGSSGGYQSWQCISLPSSSQKD